MYKFPKDSKLMTQISFGVATASYQIEGATTSMSVVHPSGILLCQAWCSLQHIRGCRLRSLPSIPG